MEVVATIIGIVVLSVGIGIGVSNAVADLTADPESVLEYCERTAYSRWQLDECIYVETRYRAGDLSPIPE